MKDELLLIPDKADIERDGIAKAKEEHGGIVKRIGKFWVKPETNGKRIALYGYDSFCLVLAQILELEMCMPKDEWIATGNIWWEGMGGAEPEWLKHAGKCWK